MRSRLFPRLTAAALSLTLLLPAAAQALTPDQALELLDKVYIDPLPDAAREKDTIPEILEVLGDRYTEYFTPEEYAAFLDSMSDGSLTGIGIVFQNTEEGLYIAEVLAGSAAEKGGLRAGDLITKVDGHSVLGADDKAVTGWIQGEEGSTVKVTYLREGRTRTATLTRAVVVIPATTYELLDDHIGYIRCTTFGNETVGHFREAIDACRGKATVWIVDLRGNLGGVTEAATNSAGLFTGAGSMAFLRDGSGETGAYRHEEDSATLYPVIVLVDPRSASASEIFASAIRDRGSGIVVGERTFGKGVAQSVMDKDYFPDYFAEGDALKVTSHRFYTAGGNTTDQVGVIPDLLVPREYTADVAYLLAGPDPRMDTTGTLRVDLDWQWYIDLDLASDPQWQSTFEVLLGAIPATKNLWLGTGGATGWEKTDRAGAAEAAGLEMSFPQFPDLENSSFPDALTILRDYGLIKGKDDGSFHPEDTLTRAELCQLLAVALNCKKPDLASPFPDVAEDAWYAPAVAALYGMGLINGVGDGTFRPEDPIDHQQLITILGRLARRLNLFLLDTKEPEDLTALDELSAYDDWAKSPVWLMACSQRGFFGNTLSLLWADAEDIDPAANATRDEAAYALYRLLSYIDILPA